LVPLERDTRARFDRQTGLVFETPEVLIVKVLHQ